MDVGVNRQQAHDLDAKARVMICRACLMRTDILSGHACPQRPRYVFHYGPLTRIVSIPDSRRFGSSAHEWSRNSSHSIFFMLASRMTLLHRAISVFSWPANTVGGVATGSNPISARRSLTSCRATVRAISR